MRIGCCLSRAPCRMLMARRAQLLGALSSGSTTRTMVKALTVVKEVIVQYGVVIVEQIWLPRWSTGHHRHVRRGNVSMRSATRFRIWFSRHSSLDSSSRGHGCFGECSEGLICKGHRRDTCRWFRGEAATCVTRLRLRLLRQSRRARGLTPLPLQHAIMTIFF